MIKLKSILASVGLLFLAGTAKSFTLPVLPPPTGQWIYVTSTNPLPVTIGSTATAQNYFLLGLEYGTGIAALLLTFLAVRRALSMGDAWND